MCDTLWKYKQVNICTLNATLIIDNFQCQCILTFSWYRKSSRMLDVLCGTNVQPITTNNIGVQFYIISNNTLIVNAQQTLSILLISITFWFNQSSNTYCMSLIFNLYGIIVLAQLYLIPLVLEQYKLIKNMFFFSYRGQSPIQD